MSIMLSHVMIIAGVFLLSNGLPVPFDTETRDVESESVLLSGEHALEEEFQDDDDDVRQDEPIDPVGALGCDNFICFLSKYDIMKTEKGYMVSPLKFETFENASKCKTFDCWINMFQGFERPYGVELKLKSVEGKENQQYQLEDFLKLKRSGLELEKADNSNAENFPQDDYPISLESDIQQENDVVHPQGEDLPSNMSLDNPKTYETFRT